MASLHEDIRSLLKPGYQVHPTTSPGVFAIRTPEQKDLRNEVGAVYHFTDEGTWRGRVYRRQVLSTLEKLGAIELPKRRRTNTSRDYATTPKVPAKTGIALANETLADKNASPRERKMAREYLKLMENHAKVRELAEKLGNRLSELTTTLDK